MLKIKLLVALLSIACCLKLSSQTVSYYKELHRPQIHFSPPVHWMNDPNGLIYFNKTYNLFYQYYPDGIVWGPMHWGHATSKDMIHWVNQPIALYPDSLGYIFSGSAVADLNNTSGFGKNGKVPLVAIFTHHDPIGEKAGTNKFQNQSLAYSLDGGKTWTKYKNNPVIKNPGIKDFRDPKVFWHSVSKQWILTLATLDRITFYSSPNLKDWKKESEFGKNIGAHGGVWECPDLFTLESNGKTIWVLIVNINPGGPNGGSGTQYFTGNFNGKTFTPFQTETSWLDYGPDEYAGVTWSNTGKRKLFIGWMSNWQYATSVPTSPWRSAMTIPRELGSGFIEGKYYVTSKPVTELNSLRSRSDTFNMLNFENGELDLSKVEREDGPFKISFLSERLKSFSLILSNDFGEELVVGYDQSSNQYYFDRSKSGDVAFEKGFAERHYAPRFSNNSNSDLTLIVDSASIELFADNGLTVMTGIFFPHHIFKNIRIKCNVDFALRYLTFTKLKSIW
ncbi:MAG: glycoside hydrolase family 32 protein [Ginsengibacter sp.]